MSKCIGTWYIKLQDGKCIPFYNDNQDKESPLKDKSDFDYGDEWSIDTGGIDYGYKEDPDDDSFSLIPKKDVRYAFFNHYNENICDSEERYWMSRLVKRDDEQVTYKNNFIALKVKSDTYKEVRNCITNELGINKHTIEKYITRYIENIIKGQLSTNNFLANEIKHAVRSVLSDTAYQQRYGDIESNVRSVISETVGRMIKDEVLKQLSTINLTVGKNNE